MSGSVIEYCTAAAGAGYSGCVSVGHIGPDEWGSWAAGSPDADFGSTGLKVGSLLGEHSETSMSVESFLPAVDNGAVTGATVILVEVV